MTVVIEEAKTAVATNETKYKFELKGYLYIHGAFRKGIADFEKAAQLPHTPLLVSRMQNWLEFYWEMLEEHHTKEDNIVFPLVATRAPEIIEQFAVLTEEHHEIIALVEETRTKLGQLKHCTDAQDKAVLSRQLRELAITFKTVLIEHLDKEELIFIPAVANNFTEKEQHKAEESLQDENTKKKVPLLLTWIVNSMTEAERQQVFKENPFILRLLYTLVWKNKYTKQIPSLKF